MRGENQRLKKSIDELKKKAQGSKEEDEDLKAL